MKVSNQIRIGLTGGIATGKSQVSNYLRSKGYKVIDADQIARDVVAPGSYGLKKLRQVFGKEIIKSGELDREYLGKMVFYNKKAREKLDQILHPLIFQKMKKIGQEYKGEVLFFDIPLLFETMNSLELQDFKFDEIWVVDTSMDIRVQRLMDRDSIDRDYAIAKINSQMPMEEKRARANYVLNNDQDKESLYKMVEKKLVNILGEEDNEGKK